MSASPGTCTAIDTSRDYGCRNREQIDHAAENAYVLAVEDRTNLPALCVLPNNLNYTLRQLTGSMWRAVKAYPHYREPPLQEILDFSAQRAGALRDASPPYCPACPSAVAGLCR